MMSSERLRRFFFGTAGAKKKLCKKKAPLRGFRPLRRATEGSAFGYRKPLKRLDLNFKTGEKMKLVDLTANISSG